MIETEKEPKTPINSPFQEEVDLENYFPCANRTEVLSQMEEAVRNGVPLMVLTGEEGSGKTMICRLLEDKLTQFCTTVFFPQTIDSFEEVVRTIAIRLGLNEVVEQDVWDIELAINRISELLLNESLDLVVIFDEAENLFLATLERIRKMLDRVLGSGARIHVIFSGRETLLENCDQLSVSDIQNIGDLYFELSPLSEVETADYLHNCCSRIGDLDAKNVFSEDVVNNIYSLAQGNFRTTNILGEESVQSHSDDTSFMVLLDGVEDDYAPENVEHYVAKYSQLVKKITPYLPWIGGGLCCLFLLIYLFGSGGDEKPADQNISQSEDAVQIEVVSRGPEAVDQTPEEDQTPEDEEPAEIMQAPEAEQMVVQESEQNVLVGEAVIVQPVDELKQQDIDELQSVAPQVAATVNGAVGKTEEIESKTLDGAGDKVLGDAEELQSSQETLEEEMGNIVKLRPNHDLKKKPVATSEPQLVVIKAQSWKKKHSAIASKGHLTGDQLYDARLLAGLGWRGSEKENMYTVQLMALASKSAEKNLKKMLAQVNYRQEAGNFYIFKKATRPENIFVFYGEYPSFERANLVKNSLPKFLRDHKPYVVSIKGAIAKVSK